MDVLAALSKTDPATERGVAHRFRERLPARQTVQSGQKLRSEEEGM